MLFLFSYSSYYGIGGYSKSFPTYDTTCIEIKLTPSKCSTIFLSFYYNYCGYSKHMDNIIYFLQMD